MQMTRRIVWLSEQRCNVSSGLAMEVNCLVFKKTLASSPKRTDHCEAFFYAPKKEYDPGWSWFLP
jgi:hypothetical protein